MGIYKHTIEESGGRLILQRNVDDNEMNKLILGIVAALAIMFTLFTALPDVTSGKKPLSDLVLALVLIFVGGSIGGLIVKLLITFVLPLVSSKVILDDKAHSLSTTNRSLDIKYTDIEDVLITEKVGIRHPINLVTLKLKNGQTSLPFAFNSYNEAKAVQEKIREIVMK